METLPSRVSLARPVLSYVHYFQAPATQATKHAHAQPSKFRFIYGHGRKRLTTLKLYKTSKLSSITR